ncbi:biopolymer transporter ExbD [Teredinibacter sp. KSP-S5-2]|uniref:ExbD/TolR family protein n=1 Tax=Teredinibacter sp. KSP-S5-2 TaxID=3034506 RepID=UPI002934DEE4|nr:biopolymer transporter ExbD [Teredinibacter sp. KSP-S5-2]WNO08962.1 biopolymer transporter ExbD [Teredinibacter sp. KSP-S5-2]
MKQSIHAKRMARHHKRLAGQPKLNLVSLMDIFTILVFFLLVNSSDVEVLQSNKDIQLPQSVAEKKPDNALVVMVSDTDILVGGRKVADVAAVTRSVDLEITGLKRELDYLAARKPFQNEEEAKKGRDVTIMGDKALPYKLLKKIMTTCAKSEYRNISLAVSQVADDSSAGATDGAEG